MVVCLEKALFAVRSMRTNKNRNLLSEFAKARKLNLLAENSSPWAYSKWSRPSSAVEWTFLLFQPQREYIGRHVNRNYNTNHFETFIENLHHQYNFTYPPKSDRVCSKFLNKKFGLTFITFIIFNYYVSYIYYISRAETFKLSHIIDDTSLKFLTRAYMIYIYTGRSKIFFSSSVKINRRIRKWNGSVQGHSVHLSTKQLLVAISSISLSLLA